MRSIKLKIDGMTCVNCENRIERKLQRTNGVRKAKVRYASGTAEITYDENITSIEKIIAVIERLGYKAAEETEKTKRADASKALGVFVVLFALYMILRRFGALDVFNAFPEAREGMGYGMLFLIGLLTSLHCVAMCGGINLSQTVSRNAQMSKSGTAVLLPSVLYNSGRVISYTVIGGIVGAVGSVVSFSGTMKGVVQLAAGVFMIIVGLNMLNLFPGLRRLTPRMPKVFAKKINQQKSGKSPFIVGLLNGLMPCGPLQAMQLYALSTGSPVKGALSMLLFSLGTVPLMFGLGALSTFLSRKFTAKMMTVSAVLVVVLGISMFSSGMSLSGISLSNIIGGAGSGARNENIAKVTDNVQVVTTKLSSGSYEPITVQKGIPVRWIIKAEKKDINGCNNEIIIPEFNIDKKLMARDNIIEFTPTESGTFPYSCWMGMIRSRITVVDDIENVGNAEAGAADRTDNRV
ncbi:MAG TPA: sulfite exporter TauE/SafE family protein [Bacillota bacterium]|nr:sulfite exporter TauE/SafE family protein [Bacillota bacterium]HOK69350.1 sulfite exporter TauE/SafE family protein [Bacillota bacterium]HPP85212.1 sulfite exporter TauE/SafE family protein [Bacillota bacterium]